MMIVIHTVSFISGGEGERDFICTTGEDINYPRGYLLHCSDSGTPFSYLEGA